MKHGIRLFSLLLALLLVIGCMPAMAATADITGELNVWMRGDASGWYSLYGLVGGKPGDPYYDYFQEQIPNLKLNITLNKGWGDLVAAIAAGDAPDVYFWEGDVPVVLRQQVAQGLCEPLDDYMANDAEFVNNFIPELMDMHKVDGKVYGIPFDVMPYGILCNLDVFDKTNTPYPTNDWTIDDYIAMCKQLTNKSDPTNKTVGIARNIDEQDYVRILNMFFQAYGVKGYKEEGDKRLSNLAEDPNAVTAIEKYLEIQADNYACTLSQDERNAMGLDNTVWDIDWQKGVAGTFPGVSSWAVLVDPVTKEQRFPQSFYNAPVGPAGRGAGTSVIGYSIYAGSKNKDLAWQFLKTLTSESFREGAHAINPNNEAETLNIFKYDENLFTFTFGIPPFTTEYKLNPAMQLLYDGFRSAAASPSMVPCDPGRLVELTRKVAKGEVQLVDALKEYDDYVNANSAVDFN